MTGEDRTGQDRTGQKTRRQDKIGQDSTGYDRIGQDTIGQDGRGLTKIGQDRIGFGSDNQGYRYVRTYTQNHMLAPRTQSNMGTSMNYPSSIHHVPSRCPVSLQSGHSQVTVRTQSGHSQVMQKTFILLKEGLPTSMFYGLN